MANLTNPAAYASVPFTNATPTGVTTLASPFGGANISVGSSQGTQEASNVSQGAQAGAQQSSSTSFIPDYSQTPILESIAQYAENMAPQVYQWGMNQWGNTQGDINQLFRNANSYASGSRLNADVGQAEAGVTQAGEKALENSKSDLESYGIDPSAGRYAALDQASRVQTAAAAAGAGNQQRTADIATSNAMYNQALSAEEQNNQFGNQVGTTANQFLGTGIQLPYSPLGTTSESSGYNTGVNASSGQSAGQNTASNFSMGGAGGGGGASSGGASAGRATGGGGGVSFTNNAADQFAKDFGEPAGYDGGPVGYAEGGAIDDGADYDSDQDGPAVPDAASPSHGQAIDDVHARLNDGEFVVPTDVAKWKGEEFFQKLIDQSRTARQGVMKAHGQMQRGAMQGPRHMDAGGNVAEGDDNQYSRHRGDLPRINAEAQMGYNMGGAI